MLAPRVQRKCVPDFGSAEPEGALVLRHLVVRACGRRSKSLWRLLYECESERFALSI